MSLFCVIMELVFFSFSCEIVLGKLRFWARWSSLLGQQWWRTLNPILAMDMSILFRTVISLNSIMEIINNKFNNSCKARVKSYYLRWWDVFCQIYTLVPDWHHKKKVFLHLKTKIYWSFIFLSHSLIFAPETLLGDLNCHTLWEHLCRYERIGAHRWRHTLRAKVSSTDKLIIDLSIMF